MQSSKIKNENRVQELSQITRSLKNLAREFKVPVIALSQLSRSVESRTTKRPILSDLRDSGSIEQDADLVLMLYRESYYNSKAKQDENTDITELIITKQRNGPNGTEGRAGASRDPRTGRGWNLTRPAQYQAYCSFVYAVCSSDDPALASNRDASYHVSCNRCSLHKLSVLLAGMICLSCSLTSIEQLGMQHVHLV